MKKLNLFFTLCAITISINAQVPQAFNYQAVIRNNDGSPRINESVTLTINILKNSINDTAIYSEEHSVTTNDFGLVNLVIGKGTTSDDFSSINWTDISHFIQVKLDGQLMGTQQLLSVPYALSASTISGYTPDEIEKLLNDLTYTSGLKLKDYDGNEYPAARVGNTLWMADDLKTMHYSDGREIAEYCDTILSMDTIKNYNLPFYLYPLDVFVGDGLFYSQTAIYDSIILTDDVNDLKIQGICPKGWRIPNWNDYLELIHISDGNTDRVISPKSYDIIDKENSLGVNLYLHGIYGDNVLWYKFWYGAAFYPLAYSESNNEFYLIIDIVANNFTFAYDTYNAFLPVRCVKDL